ncbi:MAG: translation initiation factor IF-2 [Clostridia bacterium]|nr:translation initiation factor IF-2 [Clostridia bacterium]
MAQLPIKVTQLAKDFNIKAKDIIDIFQTLGVEKKNGGSVELDEFELFLHHMTSKHQIKDLDAYRDGKTKITSDAPKAEAPKAAPKAEAPKAAPKAEAPKAEAAKAAPRAETPKAEAPKVAPRQEAPAAPKQKPQPEAQPRDDRRPERDARQGDRRDMRGQRPEGQRGDRPQRPQGASYQKYTAAPQENPFAKKLDNMTRVAQGYRPAGSQPQRRDEQKKPQVAATPTPVSSISKPEAVKKPATPAVLPAQQIQLEKQQKAQEARIAQEKQKKSEKPKREEKRAQKQQFKTITPTGARPEVVGGVNIGDEYAAASQGPKTRVVDMRTSDVNLSKYDERYNDQYYAILNGSDSKSSKQKLKKQDNRGQNQKSAKDKERAAQERIKKLEAERARSKQLEFTVPDEITVIEFASRLKKTAGEVIKKLMFMGEMKGLNDYIDYGTAEIIADEFGAKVTREVVVTIEEKLFTEAEDAAEDLEERAPVVCVMGHVDHGKTSILDAIRHTNVTRGEAGGITQAIGAYRVKADGKDITFLDPPGHEAFTAMRMRGAKSTDIAILVVAADDGVMPQTVEAINHAKAAGIDIIVAINKMDKPTANPDNVLNQLTQYELVPEAWGGDVITVPVSAHTKMGIEDLLENVLLVAEVKELRANPKRRAKGIVIESKLDRGRGPVATVLVQNGTLHQGDYVIVGNAVGRVRAMVDDKGKNTKIAGPSVPVEIIGLDDVPQAGDELNAVENERMAKDLAEQRRDKARQEVLAANARVNLDELFGQIAAGVQTLNIVVKADVAGSVEAVKASLLKLSNEEVKVAVIHSAVGGITESDVMLATASNAIIVGFNVRPDKNALDSAERNGVDIRCHRIIYEIIDEIEAAMKGMLAPTYKEVLLGHAEVRQTIKVPGVGIIAGCYIQDGKITRQSQIRIVRDGVVIFEDKISSLRRFKDDVKEVAEGYECGVGIEKFNDIREGDTLEAFIMEEVKS